ncbi:hypothetical protein ANOM_008192 [Aspergillus nomiae NRRL 13137]|uniref:GPI anchored protein n=1 Tax=Aspergillus nomiae NRRL (strain ATCC 15546 / NRRL 13137 / CBS 260.88 / M93) TaxID=1509407 RepID=A0A0L1IU17_ASPN3|nr:uncharacterized protein ANOM_008192 [Aspergillus nomiae NRRL 13137]KNG82900.1 hypothetical protein ANOM_008192 [Aspergillus nomiae NRRL 13137]
MHLPTLVTLACMAVSASAFQYPDFVPLHRRQDPGTPEYDCHANCGGVIVAALRHVEVLRLGRSKAATGCGVDATPVEASSTTTTAAGSASATETGNSVTLSPSSTSTNAAATTGATSAASGVTPSSSGAITSTPAASTVVSSATPSQNSTGGASPSVSLFPGAASTISHDGLLLSVLAGCLAVAFL